MKEIIATIIGTALGAVLGRMGGAKGYHTLYRDIGVSAVACLVIGVWGGFHWTLILCFGAMWGAMSTYFKKKKEPVRWFNWLICGFMYNLAFVFYVWQSGLWEGFGIRALLLPPIVILWCVLINNDVVEELGRYGLIIATIPLLFFKRRK